MAAPSCRRFACQTIQGKLKVLQLNKNAPALFQQQIRDYPSTKYYNERFKKERGRKFLKIELPDFDKLRAKNEMSPDEIRIEMKKEGYLPHRSDQDKVINVSHTGEVFEQYLPPEGDGKSSVLTPTGSKDKLKNVEMRRKSMMAVRKIKKWEEGFDVKTFPEQAQSIYVESQTLLEDFRKNEDKLHEVVTELAYPKMVFGLENKTIRWKFIENIEPPKVVHCRLQKLMAEENYYAQVTVRFHSKQILAVYDRFGRLMYGSEDIAKDILEYVVFENHVVDVYGRWRVHEKIIPNWVPPSEPLIKTYRKPELPPIPEPVEKEPSKSTKDTKDSDSDKVQLATN